MGGMSMAKGETISCEIFIAAKPAAVFAHLTEADKMRRWMGVAHTLEARPGGAYRVDVTDGAVAAGRFTEVVPNKRVAFTWGWEAGDALPPGASTVTFDLVAEGNGTKVTLTHSGLPKGAIKPHTEGWFHYMERLRIVAGGGDAGPDPWVKAAKPAGAKPKRKAARKPAAKRASSKSK